MGRPGRILYGAEAYPVCRICALRDPAPGIGVARLTHASVSLNVNPWVDVPDCVAAVSEIKFAQ